MYSHRFSFLREVKRNEGFTLIETLVAAMLLAISVVVVLQAFSGNLKIQHVAYDHVRAVFYAQEKIEEILLADTCSEGVRNGDYTDGYKWQVLIEPKEEVDPFKRKFRMPFKQFFVKVTVGWNDGLKEKQFELNTIKQVFDGRK